jgi:hypothetical protein
LIDDEFEKAAKEGRIRGGGVKRLLAERGIPFKETGSTPTTTEALRNEEKKRKSA